MLDRSPDMEGRQPPSQKLVLPSPQTTYSPPNQSTQLGFPAQWIFNNPRKPPTPPLPPPVNKKRNWRKDPAFIVLLAAICAVIIGGTAFAIVVGTVLNPNTPQVHTANTPPTAPTTTGSGLNSTPTTQPTPTMTVTVQPSPTATPTTAPQPTATQSGGQNGLLTVQANNVPTQVLNNSVVPISVTTSTPNSSVRLSITYNVSPFVSSSTRKTTDANGNATLNWAVSVRVFGHTHTAIVAHITVSASNNNQQAVSQTYTVQIQLQGITPY